MGRVLQSGVKIYGNGALQPLVVKFSTLLGGPAASPVLGWGHPNPKEAF